MKHSFLLVSLLFIMTCTADQKMIVDAKSTRPNVLLIMTDDQGWGDFGIHGNDSIDTPNLDRLSKEGVSFERFFVSPVCAPTRASLLTGRYHLRTGTSWVTHRKEVMRSEEVTLAESLKKAGYRTGIFGKWHNGSQYPNNPEGQGFDEFLGFTAGHWNNYHDPNLSHNGKAVRKKGYINDIFTEAAIDWMLTSNTEAPFFCYLPYNTPHSPFQVPKQYFDKYKAMGLSDRNASVHGMCENIDENVGLIFKKLENEGLLENTIILFLTDNGPNGQRYNGGMRGWKGSVHEGGMRVPLFMKWGAHFTAGKIVQPITAHLDVLPTILELCEVKHDPAVALDGKSLVPLIKGTEENWPDRQFYQIQNDGKPSMVHSAIRNEQHRFILQRDSTMLLFDMQKDPSQTTNVIADFPELKEKYIKALQTWFAEVTSAGIAPPPIPIGFKQKERTELPAPEARLYGQLKFKGKMGWSNDYIVNWKSEQDYIEWPVEVNRTGDYQIAIEYACKEIDVGSEIELIAGNERLAAAVIEHHYPDFYPSPDYVKRGEVYERAWKLLDLGSMRLEKGRYTLKLRATRIAKEQVMELKALIIK